MLSQLMMLFGFFALVLVSIYWINQAVRLFDRLIGDGQSALVFLELTALTLPNVMQLVLPMSVFAGAVYVTNRLSSDSELVVMQATGFSPWRLARPVAYYGVLVALFMSLLSHVLVPASLAQLKSRERDIAQDVTARLLSEGTFLHPATGVTFYIRAITPEGELRDVFLHDARKPAEPITYSAARAYLVKDDGRVTLLMVEGLSQSYSAKTTRLFTTHFSEFAHDISALFTGMQADAPQFQHLPTHQILADYATTVTATQQSPGRAAELLHARFQQPLLCIVAALIGFSTLLLGNFSRFGVWRQIVAALVLLVIVKMIEGVVAAPVRADPAFWPLIYLPTVVGLAISAALLAIVARPRRQTLRARPEPPAEMGAT